MFYLGIDGGGTKCHAVIQNEQGEEIGRGRGGPSNPVHGYERTIQSIEDATSQAMNKAGLTEKDYSSIVAGIGLAGLNLKSVKEKMKQWKHPFAQLYLTTDLEIASVGAHESVNGAIIIVGTGSCGYSGTINQKLILGGYGFPIGDQGSGAWMGLKAIEHTLLVLDGFNPSDLLSEAVCKHFAVNSAIELSETILGTNSKRYGEIAPLLFKIAEQGNDKAQSIVEEGIEYISVMALKLLESKPERISMIGGLSKMVLSRLNTRLAERFSWPLNSPEVGALIYGKNHWMHALENAEAEANVINE